MKNLFSSLFLSKGLNYYSQDKPLMELLQNSEAGTSQTMSELGQYVSDELIETLDFIDHSAKPSLRMWGVMGDRIDYVRLSPDHVRALQKLQEYDVIRSIKKDRLSLMQHFLSGYVISDSGIFCTMTLTAQTAYALEKYGDEELRKNFLARYYDKKDPWFGATYYSETQGGSDLGANTTTAISKGNNILLNGSDKYFASDAGIADGALVTGKFENARSGAKGLSLFFVPAYLEDGSRNYTIRRLKDKLGTTAVPTGEVEFNNSRAYLVGNSDEGIYLSMEILVISRIDDAIAALGIARKALWEAYLYANRREAFGKKLIEHPLMLRDFMEKEVNLEAALALTILASKVFDSVLDVKPPYNERYQLARMLGNMAKTIAADTSADITRYALEMMGGIGFFEEFPMAKFHRDAIVTSIWEGTSNIQSLEVLEVIFKKDGLGILEEFLKSTVDSLADKEKAESYSSLLEATILETKQKLGRKEPEFYSKEILVNLGNLTALLEMEKAGKNYTTEKNTFFRSSALYHRMKFEKKGLSYEDVKSNLEIITWMSAK